MKIMIHLMVQQLHQKVLILIRIYIFLYLYYINYSSHQLSAEFQNLFESENQILSPIKTNTNKSSKENNKNKNNRKLNPLEKDRLNFDESYLLKNSDIKNDDDNFSLGSSADSNDYKYQLAKLKEQTTPQKNDLKSKKNNISVSSDSSLDDINNGLMNLRNEIKPNQSLPPTLSQQQQQPLPPSAISSSIHQQPQSINKNDEDLNTDDDKSQRSSMPIITQPFSPSHSITTSIPSSPLHSSSSQQQQQQQPSTSFQRNRLYRPSPLAHQPSPPPVIQQQQQNTSVNDDIIPFDTGSLSMNNRSNNNTPQNGGLYKPRESLEFEDITDFDF